MVRSNRGSIQAEEQNFIGKFYHVLPQVTLYRLVNIASSPPPKNPYETLKAHAVRTFAFNEYERSEQLASLQPSPGDQGDRGPSQF